MVYTKKVKMIERGSFNKYIESFYIAKIKFRFGKEIGSNLNKRHQVGNRLSLSSYWNNYGLNDYLKEHEKTLEACMGDSDSFYFIKKQKEGFSQVCIKYPFPDNKDFKGFNMEILCSIDKEWWKIIDLDKLNNYILTGKIKK